MDRKRVVVVCPGRGSYTRETSNYLSNSLPEMDEFIKTFEVIEYVEAEDDYDKFCMVNRDNDNRKAMSLFIVYLTNYHMISTDSVISLTKQLKAMFQENMEKSDSIKIVEEICENLFIIITKCE